MEAAMPRGSSVGWFGCRRTAMRPGRPIVSRKRVTTSTLLRGQDEVLVAHDLGDRGGHFRRDAGREPAPAPRSSPHRTAASRGTRRPSCARRARRPPASCLSMMRRVTSSSSYGMSSSSRKRFSGTSASAILAATFSSALAAATPGQHVAGARRRRLGHQLLQVGEPICRLPPSRLIHGPLRRSSEPIIARRRACKLLLTDCVGARSADK